MHRSNLKMSLVLVLAAGLVFAFGFFFCFADDSVTITTYYPSPYGSYNELEVYRSVTYKPVDKDALSSPKEGELVYDAPDDSLYLYNGSGWVAQGGGGAAVSLKCVWTASSCGDPYRSCTPPSCAAGWTEVGTGCAITTYVSGYCTNTGGYCERWCYKQ